MRTLFHDPPSLHDQNQIRVAYRALEQPGVLQHHTNLAPQVRASHLLNIDIVQGDPARVYFVEAQDQIHHRHFSSPGRTNNRHGVSLVSH